MQQLVQQVPPAALSTMVPATGDLGKQPQGRGWGGVAGGSQDPTLSSGSSSRSLLIFLFKKTKKGVSEYPDVLFHFKEKRKKKERKPKTEAKGKAL